MLRYHLALFVAAAVWVFVAPVEAEAAKLAIPTEAWIELLRERNPGKADRIERRLKEIADSKLTQLEKDKQAEEFLLDETKKAADEQKLAEQLGSAEGQAQALEVLYIVVRMHRDAYQFWEDDAPESGENGPPKRDFSLLYSIAKRQARLEKQQHELQRKKNKAFSDQFPKADVEPAKSSMAPTPKGDTYFAAAPAFVFGKWRGPVQVNLGLENAAARQTFAIERQKRSDGFIGVDAHFTAALGRASALHFGVNAYDVSFSGARETIDPLGQRLLFPGVNSAGFFLPSNVAEGVAGGNNVASDVRFAFKTRSTTLYGAYSRAFEHGPYTVIGYAGLAHTISDQRQRLDGRIPGFGNIPFAYDTSFDVGVTRGMVGARVVRGFDAFPRLSVNAGATAFLNYVDADGRDSLRLDATLEERRIGKNAWTPSWSAGVGAELATDRGWTLFANYRYIDDDVAPVAVRHDAGPSRAEIERAQAHVVMLGARLNF